MKRDKNLTALTRALVRHCTLYYGSDHPLPYATDILRDLSTALWRHRNHLDITIDELAERASLSLDSKRPKKKE